MRRFVVATMATLALLALSVPALAHVTVQPSQAPTGSFFKFDVRVPNERDDADTIKVEVQFPDTITNVSFQPKAGWERTVTMKTLDEPIEVFGSEVTEVIDTVTWEGGAIAPGEFDEFGFTARTPDAADPLTFPAIQSYDGGEEVGWTGPPDADAPAPLVELAAADDEEDGDATATPSEAESAESSAGATVSAAATAPTDAETNAPTDVETAAAAATTDEGSGTQGTIALVVAVLALLVAIGAAVVASRSRS